MARQAERPLSALVNPFAAIQAWRERRYAGQYCRDLLDLHQTVTTRHPDLSGLALYRLILSVRMGDDMDAVETVLQRARESFADWPVSRELCFRDVAHYLATSGYWSDHRDQPWLQSNLQQVVNSTIPEHL
jgi:hypothetical protein